MVDNEKNNDSIYNISLFFLSRYVNIGEEMYHLTLCFKNLITLSLLLDVELHIFLSFLICKHF